MRQPVILLPVASRRWTRQDLALTLTHETAHVARWDGWWSLLAGAATALLWINPLVGYATRRMRAESERACDDEVIRAGLDPDRYGVGSARVMLHPWVLDGEIQIIVQTRGHGPGTGEEGT